MGQDLTQQLKPNGTLDMESSTEQMVIKQLGVLGSEIRQNAIEARADRKATDERLEHLLLNGCSKAADHATISKLNERVSLVELAQAEGRGKFAILMILLGAALTWIVSKVHF